MLNSVLQNFNLQDISGGAYRTQIMYHDPIQPVYSQAGEPSQEEEEQSSLKIGSVLFICLQYFQQGVLAFIPPTLILTYPTVPSYNVLSVFEAIKIPWAMKFIFAPFLEVYTYVFYGKRKFWMILSGCSMGLFLLIASFFTTQDTQIVAALIFLTAMIFSSTSDIATDACSLKDLRNPQKISFIQATSRRIGSILGGFVFLKLVLPSFGKWMGLAGAITSIPLFFRILSLFYLISEAIGHFFYKQEILQQQIDRKDDDLCRTIKQYKVFFQCRKKYFRTALLLMLSVQGLLFFSSSYQYELMKKGFSKQRINEIATFSSLPILLIIYGFSKLANQENMYRLLGIVVICKMTVYILAYILKPASTIPVIVYLFCDQTLNSLYDMIGGIIINYFPVTAISGMMITMLNSWKNLGNFASLHLIIVGLVGHREASLVGFVIHTLFMVFGFRKMVGWVKQGELDPDESLQLNPSDQLQNRSAFTQKTHNQQQIRSQHVTYNAEEMSEEPSFRNSNIKSEAFPRSERNLPRSEGLT